MTKPQRYDRIKVSTANNVRKKRRKEYVVSAESLDHGPEEIHDSRLNPPRFRQIEALYKDL